MGIFSWIFKHKKDNAIVVDFLNKRVNITGSFSLRTVYNEVEAQCRRNDEDFEFIKLIADDENVVTLELSRGWTFNRMATEYMNKKERKFNKDVTGSNTFITVRFKNSRE